MASMITGGAGPSNTEHAYTTQHPPGLEKAVGAADPSDREDVVIAQVLPGLATDNLDSLLTHMPTMQWWHEADESFKRLQKLIQTNHKDQKQAHNMPDRRPWITVFSVGNSLLGLTATNEPLDCVAFGTVDELRFQELFCDAIYTAQEAGEPFVVHELHPGVTSRALIAIGSHEFLLHYIKCPELIREYPTYSEILLAPLDTLRECQLRVQKIVTELKRDCTMSLDLDHRRAYHYIREWAIARGHWNQEPRGLNSHDIVRIIAPKLGRPHAGVSDILACFFNHIDMPVEVPVNPSIQEWKEFLIAEQGKPFYMKMEYSASIPYFVSVFMVFNGASRIKGGEWLGWMQRRVEHLKERIQDRLGHPAAQIWPQRLVRSDATPSDDVYEAFIMVGLRCSEYDIDVVTEVIDRWNKQVDQDSTWTGDYVQLGDTRAFHGGSFVTTTVMERDWLIKNCDLKPCARLWPRSILKDDQDRARQRKEKADAPDHVKPPKFSRNQAKFSLSSDETGSKRISLRPAQDVLNRIRHDSKFDIDVCYVGYKDRHLEEVQEKPAADWVGDTTHEEFIPQHRILYIKQRDDIIWDRVSKVDRVFGSEAGLG